MEENERLLGDYRSMSHSQSRDVDSVRVRECEGRGHEYMCVCSNVCEGTHTVCQCMFKVKYMSD